MSMMYSEKGHHTVEVCYSPLLWPVFKQENAVVLVTDIFRATTSMCTAFQNKVKSIIPVAEVSESEYYKEQGFIVSGERDGKTLSCAEFGNSAFHFMQPRLQGKTVIMNTTNGTKALKAVEGSNNQVCVGAFTNLNAVCDWILQQNRNVIIFCAGWKNRFSMEDTLFAGAAAEYLIENGSGRYHTICDSAIASIDLWREAKPDLRQYIEKAAHRHRLRKMGLDDVIDYSLQLNIHACVPVYEKNEITDIMA